MDQISSSLDNDVVVLVSGGLLADANFLLEKLQDDGSISIWAGLSSDHDPIEAAAKAGPLPHGKVRVTTVKRLKQAGFEVVRSPDLSAAHPDRHCDATTACLLYTSPSPRDRTRSRMPSSA